MSKQKVDSIIDDVNNGTTCVIMKPRGVKLLINSSPLAITDKKGRKLDLLDLLSTDLYVTPYMHIHKIKSKLKAEESYEMVHNYFSNSTYLTSIKANGVYVNDYNTLFHRAAQFNLAPPIVENLSMNNLIHLIQAPDLYFGRLKIKKVAESVLLLNYAYQASIVNEWKEKSKPATDAYVKLVDLILDNAPSYLHPDLGERFRIIHDWVKQVKKSFPDPHIVRKFHLPDHVLKMQSFTMTILPTSLYNYLRPQLQLAIFRTILMILNGKGYREELHGEQVRQIKSLTIGLDWEI